MLSILQKLCELYYYSSKNIFDVNDFAILNVVNRFRNIRFQEKILYFLVTGIIFEVQ